MLKIGNIDWYAILYAQAKDLENEMNIRIAINKPVCLEIGRLVNDNLNAIGLIHPNVAKIAGQVAFWIRKLKPLTLTPDSPNYLITLNEYAALRIGIAICGTFLDDNSKAREIALPPRIFKDWVNSFRYHSHSPHSVMISFEILGSGI